MHSDDSTLAALNTNLERLAAALEQSETRFRILERRQRTLLFGLLLLGVGALLAGVGLYSADHAVAQTPPADTATASTESAPTTELHWVDQVLGAESATDKKLRALGQADGTADQSASSNRTLGNWQNMEARIMAKAYADIDPNRIDLKTNPLAGITLFLGELQEALKSMPGMKADMDSMNEKMSAMPTMATAMNSMKQDMAEMNAKMSAMTAMAAEMHAMNGSMGMMAAGIDSTLGRTGRNIPFWMPW